MISKMTIHAAGSVESLEFSADTMKEAGEAVRVLRDLIKKAKEQISKPIQTPVSVPDQIKKLADLKDAGILTLEEFESKKKELLAKM